MKIIVWLTFMVSFLPAISAAQEEAKEEEKPDLLELAQQRAEELTAYSCSYEVETVFSGISYDSIGEMKFLAPHYLRMEFTSKADGKTAARSITLHDGTYIWNETRPVGGEEIVVTHTPQRASSASAKGDPLSGQAPTMIIAQFRDLLELKREPEEKDEVIGGQRVAVYSGKIKTDVLELRVRGDLPEDAPLDETRQGGLDLAKHLMREVRLYIGIEDKLLRRVEMIPPPVEKKSRPRGLSARSMRESIEKVTMTFLEYNLDVEFKPMDFTYLLPEGAQVMELPGQ